MSISRSSTQSTESNWWASRRSVVRVKTEVCKSAAISASKASGGRYAFDTGELRVSGAKLRRPVARPTMNNNDIVIPVDTMGFCLKLKKERIARRGLDKTRRSYQRWADRWCYRRGFINGPVQVEYVVDHYFKIPLIVVRSDYVELPPSLHLDYADIMRENLYKAEVTRWDNFKIPMYSNLEANDLDRLITA